MVMRMSVCTFFGHRDCDDKIEESVYKCLENLICVDNVDTFYVGTQGNFDAIVYRVLKNLQKIYTHIKCIVVLAYIPTKNDMSREYSESILPSGIENVPPRFAIEYRNKWMIKNSDYVVCYILHSVGGAYKFLKISEKENKKVINLYNKN